MDDLVTTPEQTLTSEIYNYLNPDGTWKEGWKEALLPEDLRNEKFYDSQFNKDLKELLKTSGNQAKALGKKGVVPINEKSSEMEINEWRKAHGVPDKYNYQKPELKMVELTDDFIGQILEGANKLNMTQPQLDFMMNAFHNFWKTEEENFEKTEKDRVNEINQKILTDENTQYETNSLHIDNAVRQFTQGWAEEDVLKLFGTVDSKEGINSLEHIELKPLLRKFLANVGRAMGEHRMVTGDLSGKSLEQQIEEAMKDPNYQGGYGKLHQDAVNRVAQLREQLNKQLGKPQYQV